MLQEHSPRSAVYLLWVSDLRLWPSWQMSTVQDPRKTWLATGSLLSLFEDVVSGAEIAVSPCLLPLAVACLPLWLWGSRALYGSCITLFWYLFNPLFCECARGHQSKLEPLVGMVSLYIYIFQFGLQSHISSLRLSSGHSSLLLSLRTNDAAHASLPSPHSLVVNTRLCAISLFPLVIAVRGVFCFFVFS